jgi:monofunctional biosynthetic peptidoglycan transglycosylase
MSHRRPKRHQASRHPHRRRQPTKQQRRSWWRRLLRPLLAVLALLLLIDGIYLVFLWPNWDKLARGPVPKSNFIHHYEALRKEDKSLPPLRWQPVPLAAIAPVMRRAVIVAEDSRFYEHEGIDTEAIQEAMEKNLEKGKIVYGASTISQQTVKNMFLSSSRDYLRKWHELLLTWSMENHLSKSRILEIYLNVAEFGPGVYGVEAASRYYWGIPASALSSDQAAQLAACLPSPRKHNPDTNTRTFQQRVARIQRHMHQAEEPPVEISEPSPPASTTPLVEPSPAGDAPAPATGDPVPGTTTTTPE